MTRIIVIFIIVLTKMLVKQTCWLLVELAPARRVPEKIKRVKIYSNL